MSFLFITKLIEDHATERVFYFRLFIGSIFYFLLPIFGCFSSRHLHGPPRKAFKTHTAHPEGPKAKIKRAENLHISGAGTFLPRSVLPSAFLSLSRPFLLLS